MTPDTPAMDEKGLADKIEVTAHRWAHAAYCKALGLDFEDIDAIKAELRALAATAREEGGVEDALTGNAGLLGARAMASESLKSVASVKIGGSRLLSTPQAGDLGEVKVKSLEWERAVGYKAKTYCADSIVGLYTVNVHGAVYFDSKLIASSGDLEDAKAAAQSDYTSRILSALSSSPVGEMVLVPREPTEAMLATQGKSRPDLAKTEGARRSAEALNIEMRRMAQEIWTEMLAASPQGVR